MQIKPLSLQLKEQTAAAHQQLEHRLQPFLMDAPSIAHYIQVLQSFYGFFQPLQHAVAQHITKEFLPDAAERRSATWIEKDLEHLGTTVGVLASADDLPQVGNAFAAMGALYVMEGSTLGGRMITKHLSRQLPQLPAAAMQFFSGYGDGTGFRWKTFVDSVNNVPVNETGYSVVINTANDTFLKMDLWIQKTLR